MTYNAHGFPRDLFLGFDSLFETLTNPQETKSYPPYNVVQVNPTNFLIEIAVAGFTKEDIDVTIEKGTLVIEGNKLQNKDLKDDSKYIHRGISNRSFKRTFTLADTIEVSGADIVDGLLLIGLENKIPEEDKPKTIKLGGYNPQFLTEGDKELEARLADSAI